MEKRAYWIGRLSAAVAFALCFSGGAWMFVVLGIEDDDAFSCALGLYFMGKAFFVGPMLYLTALEFGAKAR